jgi:hypothetical protein
MSLIRPKSGAKVGAQPWQTRSVVGVQAVASTMLVAHGAAQVTQAWLWENFPFAQGAQWSWTRPKPAQANTRGAHEPTENELLQLVSALPSGLLTGLAGWPAVGIIGASAAGDAVEVGPDFRLCDTAGHINMPLFNS